MHPRHTIIIILTFVLASLSHADITWVYEGTSTDTSAWSAHTMNNTTSGTVGFFGDSDKYGTRLVEVVTDYQEQSTTSENYYSNGLVLSKGDGGYLSYNLNAGDLSGYMGAQINVEIYSAGPAGRTYTPPAEYIFLEGELDGERLLLACSYPVSANGAIAPSVFSLKPSVFLPVTEFYCTVSSAKLTKAPPTGYSDLYTPHITLSDNQLTDAEFEAFLESITAVTFWAARDTSVSGQGLIPSTYTYVQSFGITAIPEPNCIILGLFGTMTMLLKRARRKEHLQ